MPIITISRGSMSGGTLLAVELKKRLGYKLLSREEAAKETSKRFGLSPEEETRGLAMPANVFERFTHRKERYVLAMQAALGEVFEDGNGIYHGIAGQFLFLGVCNVFKLRLVAPLAYRVQAAMANLGVSRYMAVRHIQDADDRRSKWVRQLFGCDINDPELYDLVINLESMTVEAAADMIAEILKSSEYQPTPKCIQEFRDFALSKMIEAQLFFNSPFDPAILKITVKEGVVSLAGGKALVTASEAIADYVSRIKGVEKVITDDGEVRSVDATLDTGLGIPTRDTTARDVMLPPMKYPHVPYWVSIREAIVALSASAVKLEDGYILLPRYLLVVDENEHLVGVVSRRELIKGLVPQLKRSQESAQHIREMVPFGGGIPPEMAIRWTSLFTPATLKHAEAQVQSVMVEVRGTVQVNDSLSTVITTMLHHGVDLVPVLDGSKVAGVVLMTNIFDIVSQFVMEHGGEARKPAGRRPPGGPS